MIGCAVKPRCFGNWDPKRDANVDYTKQAKSWMDCKIFCNWLNCLNSKMRNLHRNIWLLIDNSATHAMPEGCAFEWFYMDGEGSPRVRGFKMSNITVLFILLNVTSHVQPLDAGIINSFKAHYRKLHISWMIHELDSERILTAAGARPDMKLEIKWIAEAWREVKPTTIQNCWNKTKILGSA